MSNQRVTAHAKASSPQGWLKINGLSNERIDEKCDFRGFRHDEGQTVPRKGRPRLKAGDYVILGHLGTRKNGKNDLCIYGRGTVAVEHRDGVDELPRWLKKRMDRESWDEISRWPYIFWLGNVDIIRGRAVHAPWLSDLNDEKLVLEPKAYAQKGYVKLSDKQLEVFDSALDEAFSRFGTHHPEPGSIWWNDKINDQKYWVTRSLLESMAEEQGKLRKA